MVKRVCSASSIPPLSLRRFAGCASGARWIKGVFDRSTIGVGQYGGASGREGGIGFVLPFVGGLDPRSDFREQLEDWGDCWSRTRTVTVLSEA